METRIRDVRTCLGKYCVHFDIVDYWDHNPVADWYAVMGYEEIDGQNYWTMYENHADAPYGFYDSADGEELAEELFTELNGWELIYTSGAGAWGAGLEVMEDGRFTFTYHDDDMGDTGDGYPGGKLYRSSGSGTFSNVRQVGDYEYTMTVTSIQYDHEDGEYIENDALNIWTNDVIFQ